MRRMLASLVAAVFMVSLPAMAVGLTTNWNLNGSYSITLTCQTGCSGDWPHTMDVTFTNLGNGQVVGDGYYDANTAYTWTLTGTVSGTDVTFAVDYTGLNPSYYINMLGTIDATDGSMSGTATAPGQTFTWASTAGAARLMPQSAGDCSPGTYAGYNRLWYDFVPGSGSPTPTVTMPYSLNSHLDYLIEASGSYFAGGNTLYDIEADAEYSQDQYQRDNGLDWTDSVHNYGSYGESLLDLLVNGNNVDWGTFSSAHRYTLDVAGSSGTLDFAFRVNDFAGYNNTGGLCVAVFVSTYDFDGFYQPIDNVLLNSAKAGSAIPVKFSLNGDQGLDIFAIGYPKSLNINCTSSSLNDDEMLTVTAGGSSLSYDPLTDTYTYVWKTDKGWKGTCRQLQVKLADGSFHTANFTFH